MLCTKLSFMCVKQNYDICIGNFFFLVSHVCGRLEAIMIRIRSDPDPCTGLKTMHEWALKGLCSKCYKLYSRFNRVGGYLIYIYRSSCDREGTNEYPPPPNPGLIHLDLIINSLTTVPIVLQTCKQQNISSYTVLALTSNTDPNSGQKLLLRRNCPNFGHRP